MNALLVIFLIIIGIGIGYFIAKKFLEAQKWGDKEKILDLMWKSKLEKIKEDYNGKIKDLKQNQKTELLEIKKDAEIKFKDFESKWQIKYSTDLGEVKHLIQKAEKNIRKDAVKKSRRTLLGRLWEQVSPYLPKFPYHPSDMKFLGAPIDFIIFKGMGEKKIEEVVFLEVKSGKSTLNAQEKKLKEAIEKGKVKWKLFRVDKGEDVNHKYEDEDDEEEETTTHEIYEHIDEEIENIKSFNPIEVNNNEEEDDEEGDDYDEDDDHDEEDEDLDILLLCNDCLEEFYEFEMKDGKCPFCGSKKSVVK
jgi:predicted Holliday junction resolvase-like endonuclease